MISLVLVGLSIVVIGWIIQYFSMSKKNKTINSWFIIIYSLGVLLLVFDGFDNGLVSMAIANLLSIAVAVAVLIKSKYC